MDAKAKVPNRLGIHLVPAEPERTADALHYRETIAASDGSFAFKHLAPGRYWVVARPMDNAPNERLRPAAPFSLSAAVRAALRREAEASGAPVDLRRCQRLSEFGLRYPASNKPPAGQ